LVGLWGEVKKERSGNDREDKPTDVPEVTVACGFPKLDEERRRKIDFCHGIDLGGKKKIL